MAMSHPGVCQFTPAQLQIGNADAPLQLHRILAKTKRHSMTETKSEAHLKTRQNANTIWKFLMVE
ncbi:hypothetical protein C5167_003569 [Papaver somniferum]|uniref:Uncharacterized protein n=1 Tax=Papaver somniferum TaxID=3469 RepID=A0A4Y7L3Z6_PAPSO|nr:hypothetical protein C5167_003569 [Papaver somniferum]